MQLSGFSSQCRAPSYDRTLSQEALPNRTRLSIHFEWPCPAENWLLRVLMARDRAGFIRLPQQYTLICWHAEAAT